jgi:hypothetical protein
MRRTRTILALAFGALGSAVPALAPVTAIEAAPADSVYVIGDSLTFTTAPQVQASLAAAGWAANQVTAVGGRGVEIKLDADPDNGLTAVTRLRATFGDSPFWVVALGTNDAEKTPISGFRQTIERMLSAIGPQHQILWINVYLPTLPAQQVAWNNALLDAQAAHDGALVVDDWASLAAQHPEWMQADNIHHSPAGDQAWAAHLGVVSRSALLPSASVGSRPAPIAAGSAAAGYVPVGPSRVVDTRAQSNHPGIATVTTVPLAPLVPPATSAVAVNITAVGYRRGGYVAAYPCGQPPPDTSTVNFTGASGPDQSSAAIVRIGPAAEMCLFTSAPVDVIVDVFGAFVADGGVPMDPVAPTRLADSRANTTGPLPAGTITRIATPITDGAVLINLTVDRVSASGYLTAWPCAQAQPTVSNLNFSIAEAQKANAAVVPIGRDGMLCVYNNAPTAVVVDLTAVFAPGRSSWFHPAAPARLLDTRSGLGGWLGRTGPGQTIALGLDGLPARAVAVGTLTVVDTIASGYVTAWSGVGAIPPTSNINFVDSATRPNLAVVPIAADGWFRLSQSSTGRADLLFDLTGWFGPE